MTTGMVGDSANIVLARQYDALLSLLREARVWRGDLVPGTSTGLFTSTSHLLAAIAAFDRQPCQHPRSWRIYRPPIKESPETCGFCGTVLATPTSAPGLSSPL